MKAIKALCIFFVVISGFLVNPARADYQTA